MRRVAGSSVGFTTFTMTPPPFSDRVVQTEVVEIAPAALDEVLVFAENSAGDEFV